VTVAYITVQKFVVLAKHHAWKRLNDYIIRIFGTKGRPADQAIITPMEMLRYCRHRRRAPWEVKIRNSQISWIS
jgi:hypothetical protein